MFIEDDKLPDGIGLKKYEPSLCGINLRRGRHNLEAEQITIECKAPSAC